MYSNKDRPANQWNRVENPETDFHVYSQLLFDKKAKTWTGARKTSETNIGKTGWSQNKPTQKPLRFLLDAMHKFI